MIPHDSTITLFLIWTPNCYQMQSEPVRIFKKVKKYIKKKSHAEAILDAGADEKLRINVVWPN